MQRIATRHRSRASLANEKLTVAVALAALRELIARLPATLENPCYGTPGFYAGKKNFARIREDGESLVLKVSDLERDALLQLEPNVYSWPTHYLKTDLFVVHLPSIDATDLEPLLDRAWRCVASQKLLELRTK